MVFIDGSNLFHAARQYGRKYRVQDLCDALVAGRSLVRAYYYGSIPTGGDERTIARQTGFHESLEYAGIAVTAVPLKQRSVEFACPRCRKKSTVTRHVEKGVDVALVTDMLTFGFRDGYDIALVVAGDVDYLRAVEEVKRIPRRIEIAFFEKTGALSGVLRKKADRFIPLEPVIEGIAR